MITTHHGQTTPHGTTDHGQKPLKPQPRRQPTSTPHNNYPPPHRTASKEDNATREDNDSNQHSAHNIYAQTAPEILRTDLDDPTAVLDTGAMMTTIPRRLILGRQNR